MKCFQESSDNPLLKYLITKSFLMHRLYFGLISTKLKTGLELVSSAHFQHIFHQKFSLYNTLSLTNFQDQTFFTV